MVDGMSKHPLEQLRASERYEAETISRLRHPKSSVDPDNPDADQLVGEAAHEYASDLAAHHVGRVEGWIDTVELDDGGEPTQEYPSLILAELAYTAREIAQMEEYRDRLLVFARLFAFDPKSSRQIAQVAGLSYSSVLRAATDEHTEQVEQVARSEAAQLVRQLHATRTNPHVMETYARLRAIAGPDATKEHGQ